MPYVHTYIHAYIHAQTPARAGRLEICRRLLAAGANPFCEELLRSNPMCPCPLRLSRPPGVSKMDLVSCSLLIQEGDSPQVVREPCSLLLVLYPRHYLFTRRRVQRYLSTLVNKPYPVSALLPSCRTWLQPLVFCSGWCSQETPTSKGCKRRKFSHACSGMWVEI